MTARGLHLAVEGYLVYCSGTVNSQRLLGGKGENKQALFEHIRRGIFPAPNIGCHGNGRDRYWKIIPNLGSEDLPKRGYEKYGNPNWYITPLIYALSNHTKVNFNLGKVVVTDETIF